MEASWQYTGNSGLVMLDQDFRIIPPPDPPEDEDA